MRTTHSLGTAGAALLGILAFGPPQAAAATVDWTNWGCPTCSSSESPTSGFANGVTGNGIGVGYTGEVQGVIGTLPNWAGAGSTFVGGIVGNAPTTADGIVQLIGGPANTGQSPNTITFSTPVTNPVMAIWSLGQPGFSASFVFDQTPTLQSGGGNAEYGGSTITVNGNTVSGMEGNGTIEFLGTFKSITWRNPTAEYWYGFTVGIPAAVPEPGETSLLLAGLAAMGFVAGRRRRLAARAA